MGAVYILMNYRAKKEVKEDIKRRYGYSKLGEYSAAQINTMAQMWIEMHRDELIADAKATIAKSPELTKMYEKEQRARAKLLTNAQSKIEPISNTSAVQMLGAK